MGKPCVIKPIKAGLPRYDKMKIVLETQSTKAGEGMKKDFEATVATWEHKPVFVFQYVGWFNMEIYTEDDIYGYVNNGTGLWGPKHAKYPIPKLLTPGRKKLAFSSAFTPKTRPGSIKSGPGGSGPVDTFRTQVMHPGIEPRGFEKLIAAKWNKLYKKEMEKAMAMAAKVSGHWTAHMGKGW